MTKAETLRSLLTAVGATPTALDLAEILWLAHRVGPSVPPLPARQADTPLTPSPPSELPTQRPGPDGKSADPPRPREPGAEDSGNPEAAPERHAEFALHAQVVAGAGTGTASVLLAPDAPALGARLALQRALRPLMRRVPAPDTAMVDETATADRIAEQPVRHRLWIPVLRPVPERWLDLSLVVDAGDSMVVWSQLSRELQETLLETGIFRRVTIWGLDTGSPRRVTVAPGTVAAPGRSGQPPAAVQQAGNRHVILVLSDCTGPAWQGGAARNALYGWGRTAPVAILQPLPERLWSRTGAPTTVGRVVSVSKGAPNSDLTFLPFDDLASPPSGAVAMPVLEIRPAWIRRWANVIAGPGVGDPMAVTYLTATPTASRAETAPTLTPQQRVREFRSTASSQAFRLARCLATTTPTLPVMRLVQRAVLGASGSSLIAEVVLGGLLRIVDGRAGSYEFVNGVREVLLDAVPRTEAVLTMSVLAQVSADIQRDAGLSVRTFRAFVTGLPRDPGGATADGLAFALINRDALRRMLHQPSGNDEPPQSGTPVVPEESEPPTDTPSPTGSVEPLPRIWRGVPIRNPHFTGREALLRRLREALSQHGISSGRVLLHGLGGMGKTQVATEYVYRYTDEYDLVWWIPAERATDVLNSLAALGRRIGIPSSDDMQQTARSVLHALSSTSYRWLLVYDNAERPEEISGLIPPEGGATILTSRNVDWTDRYSGLEVDVFERAESIDLLLELYGSAIRVSRDTADRLADKLGDLPLALEQAVNFQLGRGRPARITWSCSISGFGSCCPRVSRRHTPPRWRRFSPWRSRACVRPIRPRPSCLNSSLTSARSRYRPDCFVAAGPLVSPRY